MDDFPDQPDDSVDDDPAEPALHPMLQLVIGAAISTVVTLAGLALILLGMGEGTALWICLFITLWIIIFIALRRRYYSMIVGGLIWTTIALILVKQFLAMRQG